MPKQTERQKEMMEINYRFNRIIKKIIQHDDSKQFFYYGLVCNALTNKVITHDEWKFIKEQLIEMGYFDINKCYSSGEQ